MRRGQPVWLLGPSAVSLAGFAWLLTLQRFAAGRTHAAYGGVHVSTALLWLRLVDVEAALRGRTYAEGEPVVIDVRDEQCPWNAGRYRVGPEVTRTDDEADIELDVADLACAYLGAFDFHRLARAGRAREVRPGALERASLLFRSERVAFCPEEF